MKTRHSKYSFALRIHSEVGIKPWRLRRIPTNLQRRVLTSHAVLYCIKRSLHKITLTLSHIGHTHANNGFFKLVKALLHIYSYFISHSITKVRGFPPSAVTVSLYYLQRCLSSSSTDTCGKTSTATTTTWSEPLKICGHVIVTQYKPTVEQSARNFRNPEQDLSVWSLRSESFRSRYFKVSDVSVSRHFGQTMKSCRNL